MSTKVGNLMEFGRDRVDCRFANKEIENFELAINYVIDNYEYMHAKAVESIQSWSWESRSKMFYEVFRTMLSGKIPDPFTYKENQDD